MDSSVAQMSCVLKVSINCEACRKKVYEVLQNIYGVYKINIDAEGGTVKVSGKVNPSTLLMVLEGSGKHAEVKSVTFDGEVKDDWGGGYDYFGAGYGYNPYGVAPPPPYHYPPYGGYDYHWNDPSPLIMMSLPTLPPPPPQLPRPSSSSSVPQQSQPPAPVQLQSQSVPPQQPKTPAPPNQAPPPPPPAANVAQTVGKPADKKSQCCIM
ncbi:hypothetical protein C1H46_020039 [Malus baccata]|uniref:HMA domain-containing protein n=1 Tax=Malus baccata TaxID=106549 RepID=A0A540M6H2_MALBA|nr:hypothetical protein C1H46_020039 [Malus baccata]